MYGMWQEDDSDDYYYLVSSDDADMAAYDYDRYTCHYLEIPLFDAVHEGNLINFFALLDKRYLETSIKQRTLMHIAAARGHACIVDALCCLQKSLLNRGDKHGNSPLHLAVKKNHLEVFNILIKNGANVNARNVDGKTPLFLALVRNHVELVELLLQNGADVHIASLNGKTPLHLATKLKNIHLVEIFLEKDASVNAQTKNRTPIQIAAEVNDIQLVKIFLKHGAKLIQSDGKSKGQERDMETMTALHFAAEAGNLEMVQLLIKNGFDTLDAKNDEDETPLCLAVTNNHFDVVKSLIENGSKTESDMCLLSLCNSNKHIELLQYLIDLGIKYPDDSRNDSLLCNSLRNGELKLWKYLLTRISKINANTCSIKTELHFAVRTGQVEMVKNIIHEQTSKIESDSLSSKLAVDVAVENGHEEVLKVLLEAGYSIESCFDDKLSSLHIAATFEHTRFVEMLLKAGAQVNSKTNEMTPLDFAVAVGNSNMVKCLLDAGASPLARTRRIFPSSLEYALKRKPYNETETSVTPVLFQNLLIITEMLLIAGISNKTDEYHYNKFLDHAIELRVTSENDQNSPCFNLTGASIEENVNKEKNTVKGEFRPEIIRCLLNYLKEDELKNSLNCVINHNNRLHTPDVLDVILEYYDSKSDIEVCNLNRDHGNNLYLLGHVENVDILLNLVAKNNFLKDDDRLKLITARLELLPCDEKSEKIKFCIFEVRNLLIWQNECQKEIKNMQITKIIDELNVTFYDVLMKPVNKVARYLREEKLLNSLQSSYETFPAYALLLKISVKNGIQRNDLNDQCVDGMLRLIGKNYNIQFSPQGSEEILRYLSVADRRRLLAACSSLFST